MEGGSPSSHHGRTDGRAGPLGRRGAQRPQRQGPAEGAEAKPHARGRATLNSQHLPESLQRSPQGVRPHLTREGAAEADTGAGVSRGQAGDPTRVVLCLSRVPQLCPSLLGCSFHVVRDAATHDASILSSAGVYRAPAPCQAHRAPLPWGQAAGSERYQGR